MQVKRIGYVGTRTDDVDGMTRFFRDVLGLESVGESETVTFQRLPTHRLDFVEVYAKDHQDTRLIPDDVDFMIAFVVDDILADDIEHRLAEAFVYAIAIDPLRSSTVYAAGRHDPKRNGHVEEHERRRYVENVCSETGLPVSGSTWRRVF